MSDKISRVLDLEKTNPNSVVINDETGTMSDVDISFSSENDWQNANDDVNRKIPTQASVKKFFKDMSSYVHNQIVASKTWTINHSMDRFPSVTVVDTGNNVVIGDVSYIDSNNIVVSFTVQFSGKAYLS